ncbi:MAG: DUF362 domain-containing protein [Euryarchaeota archaeon]|nr:DUF362 domain-containing protein [Euryarchaeota archaeon]
MYKATVAIIKDENIYNATLKALNLIRASKLLSDNDKVLIKPNYILAKRPETGITTDPKVVEAIIDYLQQLGIDNITIGEGGWSESTADDAFKLVGLTEIANNKKIKLVNLNKDKRAEVDIPNALALKRVNVAKAFFENNCIISVPKLKVHGDAGVTLGMKNLMGFVLPKGNMHTHLHEKIVDLARYIKPRITVIDGYIGGELSEISGNPVKVGVIIASNDIVAADAVGAAVMGIDPLSIKHIKLADELGLGIGKLENIETVGEPLESIMKPFRLSSIPVRALRTVVSYSREKVRGLLRR